MRIVLFSGKAENGKTTAADLLRKALEERGYRVAKLAYGDYVKHTVGVLFGWDGKKDEAGRGLLQYFGTDVVRAHNPDFWAKTVVDLVGEIEGLFDYVIVDDARYENEITIWRGLQHKVTTVRVNRPGHVSKLTEAQLRHSGETALDGYTFDEVIDACSLDELHEALMRQVLPKVLWGRLQRKPDAIERLRRELADLRLVCTTMAELLLAGQPLACAACTSPSKRPGGCAGGCQHDNGIPSTVDEVMAFAAERGRASIRV